jgi:hypothetical protein
MNHWPRLELLADGGGYRYMGRGMGRANQCRKP